VKDLEVVRDGDDWVAKATCDCYAGGLFDAKQYPDEKVDEYKARIKAYKENSYEEFRVYLIDIEHGMDKPWAKKLGIDLRRLGYSRPETAEEAADLYDVLIRTAEVDLIALDSIAAMTPSTEVEESTEKWQQGLGARLMGKFTRKVQSSANSIAREYGRMVTQIWINQEREKIGISFGDNKVMPYGNAQLFAASVIVKCWSSKWEKDAIDSDLVKEFQTETGSRVQMNFKVSKNKTAPAMTTGSYKLCISGDKAGQVDEEKYVLALAEKHGLFVSCGDGAKKTWQVGNETYKTKKEAMERFYEPATYAKVTEVLLGILLGG
jgi:RecA/RadA recombinase